MRSTLLLLPLLVDWCAGARILGINPTPSISHQLPFLIIMRALAERGHHVTIITTDPLKDPPPNTTQVDISFMYDKWKRDVDFMKLSQLSEVDAAYFMGGVAVTDCEAQFEFPAVKELAQSGQKFDVVILELFVHYCYFGLVQKLGAPPVVGVWTAEMFPHLHRIMGNPLNPAYLPEFQSSYTDRMTFWQRADNAYNTLQSLRVGSSFGPRQDETMRKYFGSELPSTAELQYNVSLLLVNNHYCTGYPKPVQPNIIQMTGLHITGKPKPLPQDIKQFLDGARHGAIYFSLGSNVKSSGLPGDTRRALLEAFSQLPQRVLWKFEDDSLEGRPANLMVAKWLPQQDVLAHPNVKLFITQGGLQSFNEAAYYGVPLIGIPFFGDQGYNVGKMVNAGIGVKLDFKSITKERMLQAIQTVLGNTSYQENMDRFSAIYREHQSTSLETAVWWVEYVIRHQGATHLRSAALDLRWWQLMLIDVIAAILAVATAAAFVLYKVMRCLVSTISRPTHPNVRLFITQGGLQSFNEAAYCGVPLIGIPFFGDQGYNVGKMVSAGIGAKLDFKSITKERMLQAIQTVLGNTSYQENMDRFSAIYREHQSTSLETAVWWVEYVIRHQGATHLRSAALDLRWWQLMLIDVIAAILAVATAAAFVLYKVMRCLVSTISRPSKIKKQ